jgi:hypothetical protein
MTIEELRELLEGFIKMAGDPEAAHGLEDELWEKTLMQIVQEDDPERMRQLAENALMTTKVAHEKWYA